MVRVSVILKGIRPLLMNRMDPEVLESLADKTKKKGKAAAQPPAQEQAAKKVHQVNGKPVIPVEAMMACLIEAGKYVRLDGKRQVSTQKGTVLPGLLSISTDVLWLKQPNGKSPSQWGMAEWKYDLRQGRNPNGGEAVAIVRPRFDEWALSMEIEVDTDAMSIDAYRQLFDYAGSRAGLLDFRPARKGIFGQFRVDKWDAREV